MTKEKAIEIIKKCKEKRFKHTFEEKLQREYFAKDGEQE